MISRLLVAAGNGPEKQELLRLIGSLVRGPDDTRSRFPRGASSRGLNKVGVDVPWLVWKPWRMANKPPSRRQFLRQVGIAGFAVVPLARPARAQAKRQVIMRLDWLYQGPNAGFLIAQEKGFYEQAGLNVEIGPGKGSGSTAQLVASKAAQFGFADGFVVGNSVSKGMSIKMVAGMFRRNPTAVVVLDESDIKTPKEFGGKDRCHTHGGNPVSAVAGFRKGLRP
jgi:hypothetical protein